VTRGARDVALALAALSALAPAPGPAQDGAARTSVAVVEFVTVDASAYPNADSVRTALGSSGHTPEGWLAADLTAMGRYVPSAAPQVAAALAARGLTPRDCSDLACALALGRALGVDRVVTGRISRLSNLIWLLYGAMVDVATGQVRYRDEFEIKGDIVELLPKATLAMARRLAAADSPAAAPQGERLTRDQVLAALAAATPQHPADLTGKDLSGLDLAGVDFKRANLSRCRCVGTNFSKAQMFSVTLSDAMASQAVFAGTTLDVAVMYRVDLRRANLRDASLFATILTGADFSDADLTGARVIAVMTNAKLVRATLAHANLGADPGNQSMGVMRTDVTSADLSDADLTAANLRKVNFTRANLTGADLTDADVTGADLTGAILRTIRGRDRIRGLDKALNRDQAIFND
jgi:uncharacterized protein YjbI with pentapeptide repeats